MMQYISAITFSVFPFPFYKYVSSVLFFFSFFFLRAFFFYKFFYTKNTQQKKNSKYFHFNFSFTIQFFLSFFRILFQDVIDTSLPRRNFAWNPAKFVFKFDLNS